MRVRETRQDDNEEIDRLALLLLAVDAAVHFLTAYARLSARRGASNGGVSTTFVVRVVVLVARELVFLLAGALPVTDC